MKARRPKNIKTVSSRSATNLRNKWRKWIDAIAIDIANQLDSFDTYKSLLSIVKANPRIHEPSYLHDWIFSNYAAASTVALRRFDDVDKQSQSLGRMLYEMIEYPGVITRSSHKSRYSSNRYRADLTFDGYVGKGRMCLGSARIRSDLHKLEKSCKRLRRFVNKRVAHVGATGAIRVNPTYGDLERALREIDSIVCYYQLLLIGSAPSTQKATNLIEWTTVLHVPWIPQQGELSDYCDGTL